MPARRRASVSRPVFAQAKPNPTKKPPQKDPIFSWKDHPTLTIGIVEIAFRARLQFDHEATDESIELDEDVNRGLDLSRRRIGIAGQVRRYAEFQVEYDLQDDADPWRDVYVNYTQFDEVQFQLGKFKLPFSLDENTSATNLDFVYRSLAASTLAPGRDIGWMVHGRVVKGIFRYEFGSFEHDGANARPKQLHARVRRPHRGGPDRRAAVPPVEDGGGGSARRRRLDVERSCSRATRRCAAKRSSGRASTRRTTTSRASGSGSASRCGGGPARSA